MGVTSQCASHALTNSNGSRLCAVNGWIANRCDYIGSLFSLMSGQLCTTGPKIDFLPIKGIIGL